MFCLPLWLVVVSRSLAVLKLQWPGRGGRVCWECPRPVLRELSQDAGPVPVHPVVYMHLPLLMFKEVYVMIGPG